MGVAGTLWLVAKILVIVIGAVLAIASLASLLLNGRDLTEEEKPSSVMLGEFLVSLFGPLALSFIPGGTVGLLLLFVGYAGLYFLVWSKREEDLARLAQNWKTEAVNRRVFLVGSTLLLVGVLSVVFF